MPKLNDIQYGWTTNNSDDSKQTFNFQPSVTADFRTFLTISD